MRVKFMKHIQPGTLLPTVLKFETRDRITVPLSVPVNQRLVESLPFAYAAVEIVY